MILNHPAFVKTFAKMVIKSYIWLAVFHLSDLFLIKTKLVNYFNFPNLGYKKATNYLVDKHSTYRYHIKIKSKMNFIIQLFEL